MISCSREIGCLKAFTFYVPPPFEDPEVEKKNRNNNVMWLLVLIAPPRTFCETSHCKVSFITNEWRSKFYMQMWCSLWCCQPRFQSSSSSAILNVTSPVKLVGRLSARFQVSSAHSESANWPQKEALVPAMGERNTIENLFFFFRFIDWVAKVKLRSKRFNRWRFQWQLFVGTNPLSRKSFHDVTN